MAPTCCGRSSGLLAPDLHILHIYFYIHIFIYICIVIISNIVSSRGFRRYIGVLGFKVKVTEELGFCVT